MSRNPGHHHDVVEKILGHLRAGDGLAEITARTGIGGMNSQGRRHLRRWLGRHGRLDLWDWIKENTEGSGTWTS